MIIFEQKWHTGRKEFYRYSGKYVLPVFTGILVKKCATLRSANSARRRTATRRPLGILDTDASNLSHACFKHAFPVFL